MEKPLLVPFDFSHHAESAFLYAAGLLAKSGSDIIVAHACKEQKPGLKEDLEIKLKGKIIELCNVLGFNPDKVKFYVLTGVNLEMMFRQDFFQDAGAIVMCSHGYQTIGDFITGTSTEEVFEMSHVPVITVPYGFNFQQMRSIVVAVDLKELDDLSILEPVKKLAIRYNTIVKLVHVYTSDRASTFEELKERRKEMDYFEPEVKVQYKRVFCSKILEGLDYYAGIKGDVDLIVLLSRKHLKVFEWLGFSQTKKILAFNDEQSVPWMLIKTYQD